MWLFSAYAEVFLKIFGKVLEISPFLCLRRGVSGESSSTILSSELFSAYAEVFPLIGGAGK